MNDHGGADNRLMAVADRGLYRKYWQHYYYLVWWSGAGGMAAASAGGTLPIIGSGDGTAKQKEWIKHSSHRRLIIG